MKRKFKVYDSNHGEHILELKEDGTCWADDHEDYIAVSEAFENGKGTSRVAFHRRQI